MREPIYSYSMNLKRKIKKKNSEIEGEEKWVK